MTDKGEIRPFSSSEVSTFLHSELGEAIKQTAVTREIYLGVAFVYGLRNVEYLLERLQGIEVGDRVTLYRKYNSEPPSCTGLTPWAIPDDGSSIRVINMLNDRCKSLYRQMYANANALNRKFAPITENTTNREVSSAFSCLLNDHPELFWVDISYYFQYDYKGNVIEFDFDFYRNFPDIPAAREKFERMARNLASGTPLSGSEKQ